MGKFKSVIADMTLFKHNLLSENHIATLLMLVIDGKADHDKIIEAVNEAVISTQPTMRFDQICMPFISQTLARYTKNDFLVLPPL